MIREILKKARKAPKVLVENKISFAGENSELSIYDTFEKAQKIQLASDQLLFCGMVNGKKVMHAPQERFQCEFLPHESFVMAPNNPVEIDFPIATYANPTTCIAIEIENSRVKNIADGLNQMASLSNYDIEWGQTDKLVHTCHNAQTQALLDRIVHIYTEEHPDRCYMIDLAVSELVVRLLRHQTREFLIQHCAKEPDYNGLNAAIEYIKSHLEQNLNFEDLSKIACMSRTKFFTEFKLHLGCTPKDFQYQLRLKLAAKLIKQGQAITTVCHTTGFTNSSHFCKSFKQFYQLTPSQFKSKYSTP